MKPLYKEKYPHVFEPLTVGRSKKLELKHRILMAPIAPQGHLVDHAGVLNADGIEFYTTWARGGTASVTIPVEVPLNGGHRGAMTLSEDVNGFVIMHNLQRAVHTYGTKTFCEIYHAGCCMVPRPNYTLMSASAFTYNGHEVKEMNEEDMEHVTRLYVDAARLARRSGFDGILLHYGHGWLMNNFLSPISNRRKDKYGGSVENRCRFPRQVLERIRAAIGDDLIISLRMNGSDKMEGGITPDDAARQALIFEDLIDMLHMSCGTRLDATCRPKMHPTCFVPDAHNAESSHAAKKAGVKVPVGVVGAISSAALAERLIAEGKADYVVIGRQNVADPDFVQKTREGREEDIRPCIRCDYCLDGGRRGALTTEVMITDDATYDSHCSVNPFYRQGIWKQKTLRPTKPRRVAVVGGGIAGLQAALTASERGHDVTLFEKRDHLGGQLDFSDYISFKHHIRELREYFITQLRKRGVTILLNTKASPRLVSEADFDAVIVATGGVQNVPPIPGADGANVTLAWDVFGREDRLGRKIVIVGGGSVGCETGIHLSMKGHDVTVIEMSGWLASTAQISERMSILEEIEKRGIHALTERTCTEITPNGVKVRDKEGRESLIEADSVIICAGTRPSSDRDSFRDTAFDVIRVGDCESVGTIRTAIESGWDAAARL